MKQKRFNKWKWGNIKLYFVKNYCSVNVRTNSVITRLRTNNVWWQRGPRGSCLGNSPSVAEHNWAVLPVMKEKRARVTVMLEVFWARVEVINNSFSCNRSWEAALWYFLCCTFKVISLVPACWLECYVVTVHIMGALHKDYIQKCTFIKSVKACGGGNDKHTILLLVLCN